MDYGRVELGQYPTKPLCSVCGERHGPEILCGGSSSFGPETSSCMDAFERGTRQGRADLERKLRKLVNRIESEPLATGEPAESVQLGRLQVIDELRPLLQSTEGKSQTP